jgi:hypothetical protein
MKKTRTYRIREVRKTISDPLIVYQSWKQEEATADYRRRGVVWRMPSLCVLLLCVLSFVLLCVLCVCFGGCGGFFVSSCVLCVVCCCAPRRYLKTKQN